MAQYHIVRTDITFNRAGDYKDIIETVVFSTDDLRAVWVEYHSQPFQKFTSHNVVWSREARNVDGSPLDFMNFYEQTVGSDVFAEQLADETFFINLDTWFADNFLGENK